MDKGADFSAVTNPKRALARREEEAMGGKPAAASPASAPASGSMSQAQFSGYTKRNPQAEKMKQQKLIEKLRKRDSEDSDFPPSTY